MTCNKTIIGIGTLLVALAVFVGIALAAQPAEQQEPDALCLPPVARLIAGNIGRFLVMRSELGITGEQRTKIASGIRAHRDELKPLAKTILEKRRALREAVLAESRNEEEIRRSAKDLGKALADASVVASRIVADARKNLTPDQVERIRKFIQENDKASAAWVEQIGR
jgi:Spy/CpxP family protein refolding chaperone